MRQRLACGVLVITALIPGAASAGDADKPNPWSTSTNPTFGSRIDKPDGSSALTIGRRLPTEWETKVGTDVSLAPTGSNVPSENFLRGTAPDQSTGSVWGNITMPGIRPLGFDKTAVEARIDGGKEEGKLGATLSRSVPLGRDLSVTWQNGYSITQPLTQTAPAQPYMPLMGSVSPGSVSPIGTITQPAQARVFEEALRFNIAPSGTTFVAGASSSSLDDQWHNKLSIEQTLTGSLKVTTSVEDAGTPESKKSITAGFKKVW
jgi:hypothetical protein